MFVHLHTHSPYSFLDGADQIETLVRRAVMLGQPAMALTDHNSLAAAVKFTSTCEEYGIAPILGAEITLSDESHLTLIAPDRASYATLCGLITASYDYGGRLSPHLPVEVMMGGGDPHPLSANCDIESSSLFCLSGCRRGIIASRVRARRWDEARAAAEHLRDRFGPERFFIELQDDLTPDSHTVCRRLAELADTLGLRVVATNNIHYADPSGFTAHDILRCISAGVSITEPHPDRPLNAQRYLKSEDEMRQLFGWRPDALANTVHIAQMCRRALPRCEDITPRYPVPSGKGESADAYLHYLAYKGAEHRYGKLTTPVSERLEQELRIICRMGYADYFLMVWSVVRWARAQGIRVTGRGSAADSCVAYALRLTDVDVIRRRLPFERFLSPGKTPDIDMDFPSDRRDEVFHYVRRTYGEDTTGMVCTFSTFWAKSAIRDIGKVLELPPEALTFFSDHLHHHQRATALTEAFERRPELRPFASMRDRFTLLFQLCARISGFPRHLGTHSSGVVISALPLTHVAPLTPSARGIMRIWTLDKDDSEDVGAIKLDILALRILSAVSDAEHDLRRDHILPGFSYDRIPFGDVQTYKMMRSGSAVGTFQFESAAQMSLAVRLQPEHFEDLVASVALIRPGPIRGNIVRKFTACRNGWARADVLHPALEVLLAKTYGCIVFQEQVTEVMAAMTGCSGAQAEKFRKKLPRVEKMGQMDDTRREFVVQSMAHHANLTEETANLIFDQIEGWSGYGFTEGHAASFSLTGYRSAYLSTHHPAPYFAGMMSNQPMGYYTCNSLAGEARRRGVRILPMEINASDDKCTAPERDVMRIGFRLVEGLSDEDIQTILTARAERPFGSLLDFCMRVPLRRDRLESLVLAGAFDTLHEHRRGLLWRLPETVDMAGSYRNAEGFNFSDPATDTAIAWEIEDFSAWDKFIWTWRLTGVCVDSHVMAWLRDPLDAMKVIRSNETRRQKQGSQIVVAGLNVRPHSPSSRNGDRVLYTLIEDEFGIVQASCVGEALERCTATLITVPAIFARGRVFRQGVGVTLQLEEVWPLRMSDLIKDERHDASTDVRWRMGYNVATTMAGAERGFVGVNL